ncbi:MAG: hypothetical protein LBG57_07525 [Treponema sp.]|jgi:predicted LPLAT superfamily acyltransferase|nr:hypothetical protein [Treponema sp.]
MSSSPHWSKQKEIARSYWLFKLMMAVVKILPLPFLRVLAFPVSFCYFVFGRRSRLESRRFLDVVNSVTPEKQHRSVYKHFASFALCLIEKTAAWNGRISEKMVQYQNDDIEALVGDIRQKRGALLLSSHLGNVEMIRALVDFGRTYVKHSFPVISLVDFSVTKNFSRMLRELNPDSMNQLIGVNEIGVETVARLQDALNSGGLVAVAGDRTAPSEDKGRFHFNFLGRPALFPGGSFYLASLLKVNVYFVFALRQKTFSLSGEYDIRIIKSDVDFNCQRAERNKRVESLARSYVETLEKFCKEYPYQWYNFYEFWETQSAD